MLGGTLAPYGTLAPNSATWYNSRKLAMQCFVLPFGGDGLPGSQHGGVVVEI